MLHAKVYFGTPLLIFNPNPRFMLPFHAIALPQNHRKKPTYTNGWLFCLASRGENCPSSTIFFGFFYVFFALSAVQRSFPLLLPFNGDRNGVGFTDIIAIPQHHNEAQVVVAGG